MQSVRAAVDASPHTLVFRPPYAPQVAPVETFFKGMRDQLRRRRRMLTEANIMNMIAQSIEALPDDATDLFRFCGY